MIFCQEIFRIPASFLFLFARIFDSAAFFISFIILFILSFLIGDVVKCKSTTSLVNIFTILPEVFVVELRRYYSFVILTAVEDKATLDNPSIACYRMHRTNVSLLFSATLNYTLHGKFAYCQALICEFPYFFYFPFLVDKFHHLIYCIFS